MSGRLPSDPSCPERGIPHTGFTPTGAEVGSADKPVRTVGAARSSCWRLRSSKRRKEKKLRGELLVCRRDYTKGTMVHSYIVVESRRTPLLMR